MLPLISYLQSLCSLLHLFQTPAGSLLQMSTPLTKEDSIVMTTEKTSETSSPPATHAETLVPEQHQHHTYRDSTVEGQPAYGEHGALVDHKVPQEELVQSQPDLRWSRIRHYMREPFSEL
jgi:hypothetical protein